ncbi:transmembrane protein 69-like isoform X2 [Amphiura filiformis]|uniref:transmembrane protein 69-like isoform X2 n=1 Tax=Amphiura filiformis TaxID=82378 RepID=UPI003B20F4FF
MFTKFSSRIFHIEIILFKKVPSVLKSWRCLPGQDYTHSFSFPKITKGHVRHASHNGQVSTLDVNERTFSNFPGILSTNYADKWKKLDISTNGIKNIAPIHTSVSLQANLPPVKTPNFVKVHRENLKTAPIPALTLGFSGLLPFILPTLYTVVTMSCSCNVAYAQVAYGATILSFLGGVRWGLTLAETDKAKPNWINLGYSVTPSLIAWLGLLMPLQPSIACVGSGLLFAAVIDSRMKGYPDWYRSLRFFLSTFAILSLGVMYGYSLVFPPEEPKSGVNWYKLVRIASIIVED